jgi:hypothetical protein
MAHGEMSGGGGGGGAGDAARSGKRFVCCARRGCGKDGRKRCGGCKQVSTGCNIAPQSYREEEECGASCIALAQLTLSCTPTLPPPFA